MRELLTMNTTITNGENKMFETLTFAKLNREADIAWKLMSQEEHINYTDCDADITYVSSLWMRMLDKNYYKSGKFDKFYSIVDDNYCYVGKTRYAKAVKLTDYTKGLESYVLDQLPRGYFVNQQNKAKFMKKLGKTVSVCPLRSDWVDFITAVENRELDLAEDDRKAILWLSKYVDDSGTLFSGYRDVSERRTYFTPNLQQLKRKLRDLVLDNTGYCDVDATRSYHYDYEFLIGKYGEEALTTKEIRILKRFSGVEGRENISKATGLIGKELKTATLSMIMGGTEIIKTKLDKNILAEYTAARKKFTAFLFQQPEFANLDNWNKEMTEWEHEDYGKVLSRILNRLETKKMETYSNLLKALGYETLQWMYDGLILDKKPTDKEIETVNEMFEELCWKAPLKVEKVW